jgi:beta-mannosidase
MRAWTSIEMRMETGNVYVRGALAGDRARGVRCVLTQRANVIHEERFTAEEFEAGVSFRDIPVRVWWPAGAGEQPLYVFTVEALDAEGAVVGTAACRVGFKHVAWQPLDGESEDAEPWGCVMNGRPFSLVGRAWAPGGSEAVRDRLAGWRDEGVNVVAAGPTATGLLDACDELGLLLWLDLPDGAAAAAEAVARDEHHVSVLAWVAGPSEGPETADAVDRLDPIRRVVPRAAAGRANALWFS